MFWGLILFWSRNFVWVLLKALGIFFRVLIFSAIRSSLSLEIRSIPPEQKLFPLGRHIPIWLIYGSNPLPPLSEEKPPLPTKYLREILWLILIENALQFCSRNYIQTHGTVMGTKKPLVLQTRHYKPTETFQYTKFYSCHPPGVRKGFVKGEALGLLRTYSSQTTFEKNIQKFRKSPDRKRLPCRYCEKVPLWSKVRRQENSSLAEKKLPFRTQKQYHPAWPSLTKY